MTTPTATVRAPSGGRHRQTPAHPLCMPHETSSTRSSSSCYQHAQHHAPSCTSSPHGTFSPTTKAAPHMLHAAVALQHACRHLDHHNSPTHTHTPPSTAQHCTWHTGYVVHQSDHMGSVSSARPPPHPWAHGTTHLPQQLYCTAAVLHRDRPPPSPTPTCSAQGLLAPSYRQAGRL
jgi:hypothetical protein